MSIAVAVRKGGETVVAADTQENFGDRKLVRDQHRSSKLMRIGSATVAMTGWGLYENLFRDILARGRAPRLRDETEIFRFFMKLWKDLRKSYSFVNDQTNSDDPTPFADLDSSFLVVNRRGIFHVSGNMSVTTLESYYAIGSGAPYALGVLHALHSTRTSAEAMARRACAAAVAYDIYCGGELDVHRL